MNFEGIGAPELLTLRCPQAVVYDCIIANPAVGCGCAAAQEVGR